MSKVGCAIQRIDYPLITRGLLRHCTAFFRKNPMSRKFGAYAIDDALFGGVIGVRDQINGVFVFNTKPRPGIV